MVGVVGLEPTTSRSQSAHSKPTELHPDYWYYYSMRIKKQLIRTGLLFIVLIFAYFLNPPITPPTNQSATTKVTRVIDGDTVELENKQKVRYIGIDTPELHDPRKPVECFAKEAFEKNKQLVEGKEIKLEKDVSDKDKYGRLLRYVFIQQEATSTPLFVNEYLVREGYAHASTFPPDVKYAELFKQAQQEAMSEEKGLWKKCINV